MPATSLSRVSWTSSGSSGSTFRFEAAGGTHVGRVRRVNEDYWLACPPVVLVADGMGGHGSGDVASATVARTIEPMAERLHTPADVVDAVARCASAVQSLAEDAGPAPGTTLTMVAQVTDDAGEPVWMLANIGDSRTYGFFQGRLTQLSHDHSLVQELVDAGEIEPLQARNRSDRNIITRALGGDGEQDVDYTIFNIVADSRLLLCSDGVCGEIDDDAVGEILRSEPDPVHAVSRLIDASLEAGGQDNITAVVLDISLAAFELSETTLSNGLVRD